jgi:hypothetical protein
MRAKVVWLLMAVGAALMMVVRFFRPAGPVEDRSKKLGEELKAKVAEVKAEQAERKEKTDAAVAQVDEAAKVDAAKDPVALANDLIRDAGKS